MLKQKKQEYKPKRTFELKTQFLEMENPRVHSPNAILFSRIRHCHQHSKYEALAFETQKANDFAVGVLVFTAWVESIGRDGGVYLCSWLMEGWDEYTCRDGILGCVVFKMEIVEIGGKEIFGGGVGGKMHFCFTGKKGALFILRFSVWATPASLICHSSWCLLLLCLGISREILIVRQSCDKKKKYQIHNLFGIVIIKNLIHIFFTFHPELKISQQLNLIYSFLTIVLLKIKEFNFLT